MSKLPERFNMHRKAIKPHWYLRIAEYIAAPVWCFLNNAHVKTDKAVRKLKGPYLVLASHAAFMDFAQIVAGIIPRTTGWVMSVEEFRRGDWLMYGIGGMPKRKFTHDVVTAKHILRYLKRLKHTCTLFPEARFSLAGVNERLDEALGKLCKHANVPIVLFKSYGNFINSPQWSKRPYRKIRQEGEISLLLTPEEMQAMTADEVQAKIEAAFERDEYKWQVEKGYHTKCKRRAEGLYRILYKCPACGVEFETKSEGTKLWCEACGATWEMDTLSRLHGVNTDAGFSHIPDWYRWEREEVRKEVEAGTYRFEDDVRMEEYYSTRVGFLHVGEAHVTHDENGFTLTGEVNGEPFFMHKPVSATYSVHIEYNFLKRGDCFDMAGTDTSYFAYLKNAKNYLTKLHFATEELYDYYVRNAKTK